MIVLKSYRTGPFRLKKPTGFKLHTYAELYILIQKAYKEGRVK